MRKIINGKSYDTNTAEEICSVTNGYYRNDFQFCKETLFLKKTGEFFLYGDGGAMSKYSQPCGNGRQGGVEIIPLSEQEAKSWVEKNSDEYYEKLFGVVEE